MSKKFKPVNTIFLLSAINELVPPCIQVLCQQRKTSLQYFTTIETLTEALTPKVKALQPAMLLIWETKSSKITEETINTLKSHNLFLPVIVLGDAHNISSAVSSIQAGAVDYIEKPHIENILPEYIDALVTPPSLIPPNHERTQE